MNNAGFHAEITLEKQNLVFFSVPYDDGFTAYVNGEKADILRVDEGLMAVLCPAGASSIDFVYQAAGLSASRVVTAVARRMTLTGPKNKNLKIPLDFTKIKCIMQSNR